MNGNFIPLGRSPSPQSHLSLLPTIRNITHRHAWSDISQITRDIRSRVERGEGGNRVAGNELQLEEDVPCPRRGNREERHVRYGCYHRKRIGLNSSSDDLVDYRVGSTVLSLGVVQVVAHCRKEDECQQTSQKKAIANESTEQREKIGDVGTQRERCRLG